jgi:hypothetical protein
MIEKFRNNADSTLTKPSTSLIWIGSDNMDANLGVAIEDILAHLRESQKVVTYRLFDYGRSDVRERT